MATTYDGTGKTVDEAAEKAHDKIPRNPNIADETIKSEVVQWGRKTGSIAGIREFYVVVEQVEKEK